MKKDGLISEIIKIRENLQGPPNKLEGQGKQILLLIDKLIVLEEEDDDSQEILSYKKAKDALSHTIDKDVQYAIRAHRDSQKNNAPNKTKHEYQDELQKAINHMITDLGYF